MVTEPRLVSIILPTYNRAHLLPAAIESVLSQTYPNWELIVWDDGSSDETRSVFTTIKDKRVKCFSDENHGVPYALNKGMELAKGELVTFLDDDDTWLPEKLEIQLSVLEAFPQIDLFFGNFTNFNVEDKTQSVGFDQVKGSLGTLVTEKLEEGVWLIEQRFLEGFTRDNFIAFDSVIAHKRVFDLIGYFNENLRTGMDFEFWWRFGLKGLRAAYTDKIVMNRVKYPGSLSGRSVGALLGFLKTLDACKELAANQDHSDKVGLLKPLYRNTWHNLITSYGNEKDFTNAVSAFLTSLNYGFRPGALLLIAKAYFNLRKGN